MSGVVAYSPERVARRMVSCAAARFGFVEADADEDAEHDGVGVVACDEQVGGLVGGGGEGAGIHGRGAPSRWARPTVLGCAPSHATRVAYG